MLVPDANWVAEELFMAAMNRTPPPSLPSPLEPPQQEKFVHERNPVLVSPGRRYPLP